MVVMSHKYTTVYFIFIVIFVITQLSANPVNVSLGVGSIFDKTSMDQSLELRLEKEETPSSSSDLYERIALFFDEMYTVFNRWIAWIFQDVPTMNSAFNNDNSMNEVTVPDDSSGWFENILIE